NDVHWVSPLISGDLFPGDRAASSAYPVHPERFAPHDGLDQRREPIVAARRTAHDMANGGHVVVLEFNPRRIRQQPLGERLRKLFRATEQRLAQIVGSFAW